MTKVLIVSRKSVHKLDDGRSVRICQAYRDIYRGSQITILSLDDTHSGTYPLDDDMQEICIFNDGISRANAEEDSSYPGRHLRVLSEIERILKNDYFISILVGMMKHSDVVIFEELHMASLITDRRVEKSLQGKAAAYGAHNVECDLLIDTPGVTVAEKIILESVEKNIASKYEKIFVCSKSDGDYLGKHSKAEVVFVPNQTEKLPQATPTERQKNKKMLFGNTNFTVFFVGSNHGPNLEACDFIIKELCYTFPNINFVIIGSIGYTKLREHRHFDLKPKNCLLFGFLEEGVKNMVIQASDAMINPMLTGSGSNIKVLDAIKNNMFLITTEFGMRGYEEGAVGCVISGNTKEAFVETMRRQIPGGGKHDENIEEKGGR